MSLSTMIVDVLHAADMSTVDAMVRKAQLIAGGLVVGIGGLMGTISGIMRQVGLREEAMRRWKDVYWGTAMAIAGPALVFALATIVRSLLS